MKHRSLAEFLSFLETKGHLKRITTEVNTDLEITEISSRYLKLSGPALLFKNVIIGSTARKSCYPVVTNLFAHKDRIAYGLGLQDQSELRKLGDMLSFLKNPTPPSSLKDTFAMLPMAKRVLSMPVKRVKSADCQEVLEKEINIFDLPMQKCWPADAGPLLTWPLVVTKSYLEPRGNKYNVGIYRMQPIAKDKMIMRWLKVRGGAQHYKQWQELGHEPMPVAVVLGASPTIMLTAVMPIPSNMSEYNFAGLVQGKSIEVVKCKTVDIDVPADAEIVIEGEISLTESAKEGPFGDHTGYYNSVEEFPIFTIKAITRKKNPIFPSTYTGKPPDEPSILGEALNEIFIPIIQNQFPEIVDFFLPAEGCSYRFAIVSIRKTIPGQAKTIMMGIWSFLRQFMYTKYIIVVDHDINIRNWAEVIWAIATRTDPSRDTTFLENTAIDYLDFASFKSGLGSKMGIDATNKIGPETDRSWGTIIEMDRATISKIDQIWNEIYTAT